MATEGNVPFFGFKAGAIKFLVWLGFSAGEATAITGMPDFILRVRSDDCVLYVPSDDVVLAIPADEGLHA